MVRKISLIGIVLVAIINVSHANTIRVPFDYPTIQEAVDASEEGDTVIVADGIYTGPGNNLIALNKFIFWNLKMVPNER